AGLPLRLYHQCRSRRRRPPGKPMRPAPGPRGRPRARHNRIRIPAWRMTPAFGVRPAATPVTLAGDDQQDRGLARGTELTPHPSRDGWRKRRRATPSPISGVRWTPSGSGNRTPRGEGWLSDFRNPVVQPRIWVTTSVGRGLSFRLPRPVVQPRVWVTIGPMGEGCSLTWSP